MNTSMSQTNFMQMTYIYTAVIIYLISYGYLQVLHPFENFGLFMAVAVIALIMCQSKFNFNVVTEKTGGSEVTTNNNSRNMRTIAAFAWTFGILSLISADYKISDGIFRLVGDSKMKDEGKRTLNNAIQDYEAKLAELEQKDV